MAEPATTPAPPALPIDSSDVAWAAVPAHQSPEELSAICRDVEALFRVNPYLYFSQWRQSGPTSYHAEFENQSNDRKLALDLDVTSGPGLGATVRFSTGLKRRTVFSIEPFAQGSRLVIVDDYGGVAEAEREQRLSEVDKSLKAWGEALRVYFLRLRRYRRLPGWRWYIRRVWVPMKPSQRRIVWLLYLITVVEFFFFLFVLLIYVIEQNK